MLRISQPPNGIFKFLASTSKYTSCCLYLSSYGKVYKSVSMFHLMVTLSDRNICIHLCTLCNKKLCMSYSDCLFFISFLEYITLTLFNCMFATMITLMIEFDIVTFNYRKYVPHFGIFGYYKIITFGILNLHKLS